MSLFLCIIAFDSALLSASLGCLIVTKRAAATRKPIGNMRTHLGEEIIVDLVCKRLGRGNRRRVCNDQERPGSHGYVGCKAGQVCKYALSAEIGGAGKYVRMLCADTDSIFILLAHVWP